MAFEPSRGRKTPRIAPQGLYRRLGWFGQSWGCFMGKNGKARAMLWQARLEISEAERLHPQCPLPEPPRWVVGN